MSIRRRSTLAILIAVAGGALAASAGAQTCAIPQTLSANTVYAFDTCQGDPYFVFACGFMPLFGPALVLKLALPYPAGELTVQSMTGTFDPAAMLARGSCSGTTQCDAAAWNGVPGSVNDIDLSMLDSGTYFLIIAPVENPPAADSCGPVLVDWNVDPQSQISIQDGIFRSGLRPLLEAQ